MIVRLNLKVFFVVAASMLTGCQQKFTEVFKSKYQTKNVLECDDPWKRMPEINGKTIVIKGILRHPDWESLFLYSMGRSSDLVTLSSFKEDLARKMPHVDHFNNAYVILVGRVEASRKFDGGYSMRLEDIESIEMDYPQPKR